jgi:hypothetical protein
MAIYLNEDRLGKDDATIGFPHLLVCMGVVLLTRGNMYGVHIVEASDANQTIPRFATYLGQQGVIPGDMLTLYGSCNFPVRYDNGGAASWRQELRHIAGVIGYQGTAKGFDTSIIDPADGTYVEYQRDAARGRCRIYYKRNEKMAYVHAPGVVPNVFRVTHGGAIVADQFGNEASANVIATPRNRGALHEVNYFLRLKSFGI